MQSFGSNDEGELTKENGIYIHNGGSVIGKKNGHP